MTHFQTREEAEVFAAELTERFPGIGFEANVCSDFGYIGVFDSHTCVATIDSREKLNNLLSVAQKLVQAIADNQQSEEVDREENEKPESFAFDSPEMYSAQLD